jgi:eukaryotic-like serine/threonine-protein kinase
MVLAPGTKLGPYEIVTPLGAGGMGEVYRARDTRLERIVAIKVLPASLAADVDRLRRFEQEARTVAALDHPNIVALYDVGTHDGAPYLVSEFLEGETLRQRLDQAALPQRKAVGYALEIARGLAAAHDKGVVHRDLKPENVFLTRDGRVKILDFGLAKLAHKGAVTSAANAATVSLTEPGTVMGTVGYMSPEQVRGAALDHCSDIFSFGAILYEMLSGKPAFRGDSSVETMNAILKEEPADLTASGLQVSPGLQRIVQRCMEKQPEERFQSARDLAYAIDALTGSTGPATHAAMPEPGRGHRRWITASIITFVSLAALAFIAGRYTNRRPVITQTAAQLTFRTGSLRRARFAPDGRTIVYGATWNQSPAKLYFVRTDSPESQPLDSPSADLLSVSHNGDLAVGLGPGVVVDLPGKLARMPITGGSPRELLANVIDADWSPDGTQLAVIIQILGNCQLEYPIGKALYRTGGWLSGIRFSPQGDAIAFLDHPLAGDDRGFVAMVDLKGRKTTLTPEFSSVEGVAWSPSGDEVWFGGAITEPVNNVYAVNRYGKLRVVMPSLIRLVIHDIAPDGRVLLSRHSWRFDVYGGELNGRSRLLSQTDFMFAGPISRDGSLVLMTDSASGAAANYQIYLAKMDGSPPILLGKGSAQDISPDNNWVVSASEHFANKVSLLPTGAGQERTLDTGSVFVNAARWFPDGKRLLLRGYEQGHGQRFYVQDVSSGVPRAVTPEEGGATVGSFLGGFVLSADGHFLASVDLEGKWWLFPVGGGEPIAIPGIQSHEGILRVTEDYAYVVSPESMPRVFEINLKTGKRTLFATISPDVSVAGRLFSLVLGQDNKHFAYTTIRDESALFVVDGLL